MKPSIRDYRGANLGEGSARSVVLDDNPTTCTLLYFRIEPAKISSRRIHPWEYEVYIIQGSGTLICAGTEYPVKEGMLWLCRPTCNISGRMKLGYRYPV